VIGSIRLGSLFLTLPTRALTGQHVFPARAFSSVDNPTFQGTHCRLTKKWGYALAQGAATGDSSSPVGIPILEGEAGCV
jgi:hypothetical protein